MSVKTEKTKARKQKASEIARNVAQQASSIVGEVVAFEVTGTFPYQKVKECLAKSGLNQEVAREFLPKTAFARAARKLSDDRVIDVLPDKGTGEIEFQFTKKLLVDHNGDDQWDHFMETKLYLHKDTGAIRCPIPELEEKARELLDQAMTERTASDVTMIVRKLYNDNSDLIPFGNNGTYIVLKEQMEFSDMVHCFLNDLTGTQQSMMRLPIASGFKSGDECVATSVKNYLLNELAQMKTSIEEFTINTKSSTISRYAEKIKNSRNRVLGFVDYLKDSADEIMDKVQELDEMTVMQIERIKEERANAPETEEGQERNRIFGHSVTSIIRWCGKDRWTYTEVRALMDHYGIEVAKSTITSQIAAIQSPTEWRGKAPELTDEQAKELRKIVGHKAVKV